MFLLKVTVFFLVALAVGADKKIELQDIEEDNLKSELEKDHDKSDTQQNSAPDGGLGFNSLDFMKTGLLKFFGHPQTQTQHPQQQQPQQRYLHQYDVTEPPERYTPPGNKAQFGQAPQQAMVGYLSNMPMQIYLVPQYYSTPVAQQPPPLAEFNPSGPHGAGTANNYVEAPPYSPPTAPPPTYVYRAQPTAAPALATVQPLISYQPYQVPVLSYNSFVPGIQVVPSTAPKPYFANSDYSDTNTIDGDTNQSDVTPTYHPPTESEFPRHYNSRAPIRGHIYKHPPVPELPHPNPLLIKAPPPHLSHIPRVFPTYRPFNKQVYQESDQTSNSFAPRPFIQHGQFKRRPTSLLDSYIPSSIQVEYLKRGLAKDPSSLYDALSSGRFNHPGFSRHVERGFLPNQMYPTAAGGVTFGHYKRNSKTEKFPRK